MFSQPNSSLMRRRPSNFWKMKLQIQSGKQFFLTFFFFHTYTHADVIFSSWDCTHENNTGGNEIFSYREYCNGSHEP